MPTFSLTAQIPASCDDVWARITSTDGINDELSPVMKMTVPHGFRGRTIADVESGTHVGLSKLLLLGLVPFEYDDIMIAELEPGRRFLETSEMRFLQPWRHERALAPAGDDTCKITDTIDFEVRPPLARIPGLAAALTRVLRALFTHRHRRLVAHFAR